MKKIGLIKIFYFSPTGKTKKILEEIANGINAIQAEFIDLTENNNSLEIDVSDKQPDLVLIGMPTYASRIPPVGAKLMQKIKGTETPVVLVATYGNNKFGDILLEMKDIASANGFIPIAAGAFIGEHSFSNKEKPIANGRPDASDIQKAKEFGKAITTKLLDENANFATGKLAVPGNYPYRELKKIPANPPETIHENCTECGICREVCPVDAIQKTDHIKTNPELCIYCCACVKACSVSARKVNSPFLLEIAERLYQNCQPRKEPEVFI